MWSMGISNGLQTGKQYKLPVFKNFEMRITQFFLLRDFPDGKYRLAPKRERVQTQIFVSVISDLTTYISRALREIPDLYISNNPRLWEFSECWDYVSYPVDHLNSRKQQYQTGDCRMQYKKRL